MTSREKNKIIQHFSPFQDNNGFLRKNIHEDVLFQDANFFLLHIGVYLVHLMLNSSKIFDIRRIVT